MNSLPFISGALIALTPNGLFLAKKTAASLPFPCTIYAKGIDEKEGKSFNRLRDIMGDIIKEHKAIIFFSAVGIAVRLIAPYIVRKDKDPAVIAIDEQGRFAVSVLSGHLGGANELCQKAAALLGATAVITTATDSNGLLAPDLVARKYHLLTWPIEQIKVINSHLLQKKDIIYHIDADLPLMLSNFYCRKLKKLNLAAKISHRHELTPFCAFITAQKTLLPKDCLALIVPRLCAGIGCRRGTSCAEIKKALTAACAAINCSFFHLAHLASTVVKKNETGLLELASQYDLPLEFYDNDYLKNIIQEHHLAISPFVEQTIGIGNVCEASALACKEGKIILPKTKFKKVTVSLIWENSMS